MNRTHKELTEIHETKNDYAEFTYNQECLYFV